MKPGIISPPLKVPSSIPRPPYALNGVVPPSPFFIAIHDSSMVSRMRVSCNLARRVLDLAMSSAKVGMTTDEIDVIVHDKIVAEGAYPSPLNYAGFPKSVCAR